MQFSIVTPSFRSSKWLKLCIASVADQRVPLEHIIQDSCSDDGTLDWLPQEPRVKAFVEKDAGMYDAINRGLRRASGDIIAYLNCDEQYLPGTLAMVGEYFERHPAIDVLFGNIIFINPNGEYQYHRKVQVPLLYHTWTWNLSTLSCAMFFRRRIISELNEYFDTRWRAVGDGEWMIRLLKRGVPMASMGQFTSVFTLTGVNLSDSANAAREAYDLHQTAPLLARALRPAIKMHHRLRRFLGGMYRQEPFTYDVYTTENPASRRQFTAATPRAYSTTKNTEITKK